MKCLVLADQDTLFVKEVCSRIKQCGGTVEVCHPRLIGKKTEKELHSFTHTALVQTQCEYKITVLFGDALQEVDHTAMLGLRVDWPSMAKLMEFGLMVVPSLPHAEEFLIYHGNKGIFASLRDPFLGTRHGTFGLAVREGCELVAVAKTSYGEAVAFAESDFDNRYLLNLNDDVLFGPIGEVIFKNFLTFSPNKPKTRRYNLGGFVC